MRFEVGFEGSLRVDKSEMRKGEFQIKGPACRKPRGKSSVDTGLSEKIEGDQTGAS